jgi:hypothetical protein
LSKETSFFATYRADVELAGSVPHCDYMIKSLVAHERLFLQFISVLQLRDYLRILSLYESFPFTNPFPLRILSLYESFPFTNPFPTLPNKGNYG